jgi:hypothetical protein
MKIPTPEDIFKKWKPILESTGLTGSHLENLSQLAENGSNQILQENTLVKEDTSGDFPSIFPLAMKVAARTISSDLIFASKEEIDEVKNRVQSENRDGKIEAIIEGGEFVEKKLEDDDEYKKLMKKGVTPMSAPSGRLFYLDFKYGGDVEGTGEGKSNKKNIK